MELKEADSVTVVLAARSVWASIWGLFGAVELTIGLNRLIGTGNLLDPWGWLQVGVSLVFIFFLALNASVMWSLAKEVEPITSQDGKEIWGSSLFPMRNPRRQ